MIKSTIAPWLSVKSGTAADFYKSAFGATEVFRLEAPDGSAVSRLSVDGAEFWISDEFPDGTQASAGSTSTIPVRMILTVADPDTLFARALNAGASQVFPVGEEHGWRLGRLIDPFGFHWEIGRPLDK